jgi:HK97 family phage portal protein
MYGDDMREIVDHPILDLLNSANPYLNGFDLSVLRVLYGELTGNAYLHPVIDDASGVPIELWPLAPQHVEVIPDEDTFIRGYVYGVDSQRKQIFEPDEVIHFRRPNPGNLFYGMGKVEAAFGVIASNEALHQMDLSTFQNSARPDYAVVVKGTPTGDQLDRFQQQVEQRLRGTRKDGNFITVTGDVQFTPLNFPPKDIAGREEIVEEIAAVFGVPVSMLKANDPNLASATSGFAQWREGTVLPLVRMDEQELNQRLLGMFGLGEEYCLAYDNPVPVRSGVRVAGAADGSRWRLENAERSEARRRTRAGRERVRGSVARERSTARRRGSDGRRIPLNGRTRTRAEDGRAGDGCRFRLFAHRIAPKPNALEVFSRQDAARMRILASRRRENGRSRRERDREDPLDAG